MGTKIAIQDNQDVINFLKASKNLEDEVRMYLIIAFGMHPKNLRTLKAGDDKTKGNVITKRGVLEFKRAKNQKPRRELLSEEIATVIWHVAKRGKLNVTNTYLQQICKEQGRKAIPKYKTPPVSPMTLRHTYILNQLRRHTGRADRIDLVTKGAGCTRDVVMQNYLDYADWEGLSNWKFGEY